MARLTNALTGATAIALLAMTPFLRAADSPAGPPPFSTSHPELRAALQRIARGSASWRAAMAAVAATGRTAVVVTPDEVVVSGDGGAIAPFDPTEVAAVAPVTDARGAVTAVLVVVNLPRIQAAHDRLASLPGELHADLERVLAHEVYGHAVPYLLSGALDGRCADPLPGQPAAESCAIQRENVIRAELRLGRRTDASLGSLALARSPRD